MSHTNTTTNYGLPQFLSSDKPAWMADINVAFADIDGQMKTNADAASAAQTTADDAVLNGAPGYSNLSTYAVGDVVNYLGRVYKCDIAVTTPEAFDNAKWSYYRLSDASAQLDVIDDEIGSTDISGIGDGTLTGAINHLNDDLSRESVTISLATNNTSAYKVGKLVSGTTKILGVTAIAESWVNIARISHKPSIDIYVPCVSSDDGAFVGMINIKSSNGDIDLYSSRSISSFSAIFTFGYETND